VQENDLLTAWALTCAIRGSGGVEKAGRLYLDGDVACEMGMGMVSGVIYLKGNVEEPLGNVVEVVSDQKVIESSDQ